MLTINLIRFSEGAPGTGIKWSSQLAELSRRVKGAVIVTLSI